MWPRHRLQALLTRGRHNSLFAAPKAVFQGDVVPRRLCFMGKNYCPRKCLVFLNDISQLLSCEQFCSSIARNNTPRGKATDPEHFYERTSKNSWSLQFSHLKPKKLVWLIFTQRKNGAAAWLVSKLSLVRGNAANNEPHV